MIRKTAVDGTQQIDTQASSQTARGSQQYHTPGAFDDSQLNTDHPDLSDDEHEHSPLAKVTARARRHTQGEQQAQPTEDSLHLDSAYLHIAGDEEQGLDEADTTL